MNFNTEQEANQALLNLTLVQEATKRARDQATEEQLESVTTYDEDGRSMIAVGELLTEEEFTNLIIEIAKEMGVYG